MALNACELELDLFSRGLRIPLDDDLAGRTAAGDSLEVAISAAPLPKREIYVNVPVVDPVTRHSPYRLARRPNDERVIVDDRDATVYPVRIPRAPAWLAALTSRDVPMREIGVLRGPQLHVRVTRFTNIDDVVETCWAAKRESGVTFVELEDSVGDDAAVLVTSCVATIKQHVGMLVGVHLGSSMPRNTCAALIGAGVNQLSFSAGQDDLDALAYSARRMPPGAVSGEFVAGAAPLTAVMADIDRVAAAGAFPTVLIAASVPLQFGLPTSQELRGLMQHVYRACRRHWLPIGVDPNAESSIVVDPDDAVLLVSRDAGFYCYEAFRLWRRFAGALARWKEMRAA
jgi:hypothetical protein